MHSSERIVQAEGVTATERLLKTLCDHSFLRMWTYPGIYRDQSNEAGGHGKEVCDVLVAFRDAVLIFSDKSCQFNSLVDEQIAWKRWFRKSIFASAEQTWGAERWIREHPDRLFIDRSCKQRFPLPLPALDSTRFHHVVVAHGLPRSADGGTNLAIDSRLLGLDAHAPQIGPCRPFVIGWLDTKKSFVHVFSGASLENILKKLDTVSDFTRYLMKKERLVREGFPVIARKEEDLLAVYLRQLNSAGEHDFVFSGRPGPLDVRIGEWERFENSSQRRAQIKADRISQGWDWLIDNFTKHIFDATAYYSSATALSDRQKALGVMASENRTRRRLLAQCLWDLMRELGNALSKVRVMVPASVAEPAYVFLLIRQSEHETDDLYRVRRRKTLYAYCMVAKLRFPATKDLVGLAMEPFDCPESSQDALYLDGANWNVEAQAEAEDLRNKLGLLRRVSIGRTTVNEYPSSRLEYFDI